LSQILEGLLGELGDGVLASSSSLHAQEVDEVLHLGDLVGRELVNLVDEVFGTCLLGHGAGTETSQVDPDCGNPMLGGHTTQCYLV
jgi:hypothetical protein